MARKLPANIEQLPSGHYRGRYVGPDGRRHATPAYRKPEEAVWALNRARGDVANGDWLDPVRSAVTLDWWFERWMPTTKMRGYVREKEEARYRNHIKTHLGHLALTKITPFTLTTWHAALAAAGTQPATISKAHGLLKACLGPRGGAMSDERLKVNPCQLVRPPTGLRRKWQLVTRPEFDRLLEEIPAEWRVVVLLAVMTGLRWSEIVGLQRDDYNPLRGELTVRRATVYHKGRLITDDPKDREERTVPTVPDLTKALNAHIAARPLLPADRLFVSPRGNTLCHPHFTERIYKPAAVRAGLARWEQRDGTRHYVGVRFHDLRHSFISWLLNAGVDIHEVKELAGHASIATTDKYAHTDREELRSAMSQAFG